MLCWNLRQLRLVTGINSHTGPQRPSVTTNSKLAKAIVGTGGSLVVGDDCMAMETSPLQLFDSEKSQTPKISTKQAHPPIS